MTNSWKTCLCLIFILYPSMMMKAQNLQTVVSVDSQIGYSNNIYLNPFFSAWNPSIQSGYGLFSIFGQTFWNQRKNTIQLTGGLIGEPFYNEGQFQKGGVGLLTYRRTLSNSFNAGIEAGSKHFWGLKETSSVWLQPHIAWFISPFTSLKLTFGSYIQSYNAAVDSLRYRHRSNVYGLEFETWPTYHWQIKSAFYSTMDELFDPQKQLQAFLSIGYSFLNGTKITTRLKFHHYQFKVDQLSQKKNNVSSTKMEPSTSGTLKTNDQILQLGLTGRYPLNKSFSAFVNIKGVKRNISVNAKASKSYRISAGIRFSFNPHFGRHRKNSINPAWRPKNDTTMVVIVHYSGKGQLYLVGEFNNWKRTDTPLIKKSKNTYRAQIDVSKGTYEYKVLHIEGNTEEWLPFSKGTYTVDDGFGGKNTVMWVK